MRKYSLIQTLLWALPACALFEYAVYCACVEVAKKVFAQ